MRTFLSFLAAVTAVAIAFHVSLPAQAQATPSLAGGDVLVIGGKKTHGSCRSFLVEYRDFTSVPALEVHTAADGVDIRELTTVATGVGTGTFQFTLHFADEAPASFTVEVFAHGGTGGYNSGMKRKVIEVRRL